MLFTSLKYDTDLTHSEKVDNVRELWDKLVFANTTDTQYGIVRLLCDFDSMWRSKVTDDELDNSDLYALWSIARVQHIMTAYDDLCTKTESLNNCCNGTFELSDDDYNAEYDDFVLSRVSLAWYFHFDNYPVNIRDIFSNATVTVLGRGVSDVNYVANIAMRTYEHLYTSDIIRYVNFSAMYDDMLKAMKENNEYFIQDVYDLHQYYLIQFEH